MRVIITLEATPAHMIDDAALLRLIESTCSLRLPGRRRIWRRSVPLLNSRGDRHTMVCCVCYPNDPQHISLTFECSLRAARELVRRVDGDTQREPDLEFQAPDRPLVGADDMALPLLDSTLPRIRIARDYNGY